jgi:hypothetical protein
MKISRQAIIGLSTLVFLAAVCIPAAEAQIRRPWRAPAGAVDLTDEQLDRIDKIRLAFQDEILPLEMKWDKLDLELESLYRKGQDLDAKLKELEALELEMDKTWEEHRTKIRAVLTDDQKALFDRYGGLGLGPGWGPGAGYGQAPRWGLRTDAGRGMGYGWAPGAGRGLRGYGRYPRYGRGYGRGMGRGYYCPWRRW